KELGPERSSVRVVQPSERVDRMANEQDVDVESEPVPKGEETSSEGIAKQNRLGELQGEDATPEEPKPQRQCGMPTRPGNVRPGGVAKPQLQWGVPTPPGNVRPGKKRTDQTT